MPEPKAIEELQKRLKSAENGWRYWKSRCQDKQKSLEKENKELRKENRQLSTQIITLEMKIEKLTSRLVSRGIMDP